MSEGLERTFGSDPSLYEALLNHFCSHVAKHRLRTVWSHTPSLSHTTHNAAFYIIHAQARTHPGITNTHILFVNDADDQPGTGEGTYEHIRLAFEPAKASELPRTLDYYTIIISLYAGPLMRGKYDWKRHWRIFQAPLV